MSPLPEVPRQTARAARRVLGRAALERVLAVVLVALLVAALVPMVAISAFDHSYADDWHYAVDVHLALEAGGGLIGALQAALAEVANTFMSWQGTYSAIFLMALEPGVWGESFYGLGAVAIMGTLVASTLYVSHILVCEVLGASRSVWLATAAAVLLLQTQLLPSPVEGFWWYNSAVYYTFYHALLLVMAALVIRILLGRTRRGALSRLGMVARAAVLALLAFVVAGGNFVTALVGVLALAGATVAGVLHRRRRGLALVPALLVFVGGFAASMAAPGNAVRQATQFPTDALGPVATIAKSVLAGGEYLVLWTNGLLVLMLALVLPLLARAAVRSRWSFRLPGLVLAGALVLFMASFTPTFYSMGSVGPGRVQNIRYDLFVLLVFGCANYLAGWCARRWPQVSSLFGCAAGKERVAAGSYGAHAAAPCAGGRSGVCVAACGTTAACPSDGLASGVGAPDVAASVCSPDGSVVGAPDRNAAAGSTAVPVRSDDRALSSPIPSQEPSMPARSHRVRALAVYTAVLLGVLALSVTALALDTRHVNDLVAISATRSLVSGEAAEYDRQVRARIERIEGADALTVEVPYITTAPKVLFMGDIRDNMDTYINFRLAQWYGKDAITAYHGQL